VHACLLPQQIFGTFFGCCALMASGQVVVAMLAQRSVGALEDAVKAEHQRFHQGPSPISWNLRITRTGRCQCAWRPQQIFTLHLLVEGEAAVQVPQQPGLPSGPVPWAMPVMGAVGAPPPQWAYPAHHQQPPPPAHHAALQPHGVAAPVMYGQQDNNGYGRMPSPPSAPPAARPGYDGRVHPAPAGAPFYAPPAYIEPGAAPPAYGPTVAALPPPAYGEEGQPQKGPAPFPAARSCSGCGRPPPDATAAFCSACGGSIVQRS